MKLAGRSFTAWLAASACCAALLTASAAVAQVEKPVSFDITATDLGAALNQFAQQSDHQIVFAGEAATGKRARPLRGSFRPDQALVMLLQGSGLTYRMGQDNIIIIAAGLAAEPGSAARPEPALPANPTRTAAAEPMTVPAASRTEPHVAGIEEILVTARRREENLQQVPLSVTAMTQVELKERNVTTLEDLQAWVPSLTQGNTLGRAFSNPSGNQQLQLTNMRGVSRGVTTYFNEVPSQGGAYFDNSNVQVLKGPQGTLFGGTSTGGAVLVQPALPSEGIEAYLEGTFGNYGRRDFEAMLNVPVIDDKLLLRLSGSLLKRRGFTQDINTGRWEDGIDQQDYRLSVTMRPVEGFENRLVGMRSANDSSGGGEKLLVLNPNGTAVRTFGAAAQAALVQSYAIGPRRNSPGRFPVIDAGYWQVIDIATWQPIEQLTLKNILSYNLSDHNIANRDNDGTPMGIGGDVTTRGDKPTRTEQIYEEAQLLGSFLNGHLSPVLGAQWSIFRPHGAIGQIAQDQSGAVSVSRARSQVIDKAVFAHTQADLSDLVSGLRIAGGYRYSQSRTTSITSNWRSAGLPATSSDAHPRVACNTTGADANCELENSVRTSGKGWSASVDYQITPDQLVYIKSAKAYRPGGINSGIPVANDPRRKIAPESVRDLEIGMKADWNLGGDARARTNIAAYQIWYDDVQLSQSVVINGVNVSITQNAANQKIKGLEFEGVLVPTAGLEFSVAYAFTYGKFSKFKLAVTSANFDTPLLATPRHKVSGRVKADLRIPESLGQADASLSGTFQSRFAASSSNDPYQFNSPFAVFHASLNWRDIAGWPVDATLSVSNLFDRTYLVGIVPLHNSLGFSAGLYNEPRMVRARLRYRFGI